MAKYIDLDKAENYRLNCRIQNIRHGCGGDCFKCYCNNGGIEEVVPVVHAKWKILENDCAYDDMFTYECSNCLGELCMKSDDLKPYCPNCNAKMDKE